MNAIIEHNTTQPHKKYMNIHNQETLEEALGILRNATVQADGITEKLENLSGEVIEYWESTGRLVSSDCLGSGTLEQVAFMFWDKWEPMPDVEELSSEQYKSLEDAWMKALGWWEFGEPISFPYGGCGDVVWLSEFKGEDVVDWFVSAFEKVTEEVEA